MLSYKSPVPKHDLSFVEMVKELASFALYGTGVEIVLQRDLNTLIKANELVNEPRDISWLKEQIKADSLFDADAIIMDFKDIIHCADGLLACRLQNYSF